MGFDNHKQEVFNLVQVLKMLFLYTQGEKDTVEEFMRNFRSLWEMVEAFGGSPGVHKGLIDGLLSNTTQVNDMHNPTNYEIAEAEDDLCKAVKATLLISGANKRQYGKLKDKLANNYLLGSDQYPDTFEKAMHILGNYQVGKTSMPFRASPNDTGVAFIQQGGQGGQGRGGRGKGAGRGDTPGNSGADAGGGGGSSDASTITGVGGPVGPLPLTFFFRKFFFWWCYGQTALPKSRLADF